MFWNCKICKNSSLWTQRWWQYGRMFWTGSKAQQGRSHAPINRLSQANKSLVVSLLSNERPCLLDKTPPTTADRNGLARLFTKTSKQCVRNPLFWKIIPKSLYKLKCAILIKAMAGKNPQNSVDIHHQEANSFFRWWSLCWFSHPLFWSRASTLDVTATSHRRIWSHPVAPEI